MWALQLLGLALPATSATCITPVVFQLVMTQSAAAADGAFSVQVSMAVENS